MAVQEYKQSLASVLKKIHGANEHVKEEPVSIMKRHWKGSKAVPCAQLTRHLEVR